MKKILPVILILVFIFAFALALAACGDGKDGHIAFATDLHIVANSIIDENYQEYANQDKVVHLTEAITNTLIDNLIENKTKVLLIGGDIAEDGDETTHLSAAKIFHRLEEEGIKVLVINGNHDVAAANGNNEISAGRFAEIYNDFGYSEALAKFEGTLSYTAEIDKYSRLIAIDNIVHTEVNADGSLGEYNKPESLTNEHINWVIKQVKTAVADGKKPIIMTHISLINHFPKAAQMFFNANDQLQYDKLMELLADNKARYVLAGHYHFQDISEYKSQKGNSIYEAETASLSFFPCSYRTLKITKDSVQTNTVYIEDINTKYLPSSMPESDIMEVTDDFQTFLTKRFDRQLQNIINGFVGENGTLKNIIKGIEESKSNAVLNELYKAVYKVVYNPFYIKDEQSNQTSLERILNKYDIQIGNVTAKNLYELLPKLGEILFKGNENLENSDEIEMVNYSLMSLFYYIDEMSEQLNDLNPQYPKINLDLANLFNDGSLECYQSNFVPFVIAVAKDIDESIGNTLNSLIGNDLLKNSNQIVLLLNMAMKGVISGNEILECFGKYDINFDKLLNEKIWGMYAADFIKDSPPNDETFTFEWEQNG